MMTTELIGYLLAILVGVSLGLIGCGSSVLTVPILVYVMGVMPPVGSLLSVLLLLLKEI